MLGVASLHRLALGALSVQDAGGFVAVVDFDAVGRLQHWGRSLDYLSSIGQSRGQSRGQCATFSTGLKPTVLEVGATERLPLD